jgi:predicted ATPase
MGNRRCACTVPIHDSKLVVLTGGPGAGKTAVLEVVQRYFCEHVQVLPEAAGIIFGGGFPRLGSPIARRAAQHAIFAVQRQLERLALEERTAAIVLCDRGTLDGLAYWPDAEPSFWQELQGDRATELARYSAVIHLRTPVTGYNHRNALRTESAQEAAIIDERIVGAWRGHPRRIEIPSAPTFLEKLTATIAAIRAEVPSCCQSHPIQGIGGRP